MSVRGIRQLRELTIKYSDIDGSSRGIREWMNTHLLKFAKENPTLLIRTERKRNQHPFLRGHYLNGNSKTIGIKNQSVEQIHDYVFHLRNQIGRRMNSTGYKKPVLSNNPSIQGEWNERMDLFDKEITFLHK